MVRRLVAGAGGTGACGGSTAMLATGTGVALFARGALAVFAGGAESTVRAAAGALVGAAFVAAAVGAVPRAFAARSADSGAVPFFATAVLS